MRDSSALGARSSSSPARFGALALLLALGSLGGMALRRPAAVQAIGHAVVIDLDGDGLSDGAEAIFGTADFLADTDGDGYSDAEELARNSDPLAEDLIPLVGTPAIGLDASAHDGNLHLISSIYVETAQIGAFQIQLGLLVGGQLVFVAPTKVAQQSTLQILPAAEAGHSVITVDTVLRTAIVHKLGSLTFVSTLVENAQVAAADKVDLEVVDGILARRLQMWPQQVANLSSAPSSATSQAGANQLPGPWTLYQPIGGDEELANSWVPGAVCVQQSEVVGAVGATVTHQVVFAECQGDWDGYCSGTCPGSVGSTYSSVDPGALIGG